MAAPNAAGSPGSAVRPWPRLARMSAGPPRSVATTGRPAPGGLQQGEAEGLGEGGVHEDAAPRGGEGVERGDVLGRVAPGQGHAAPQPVPVDRREERAVDLHLLLGAVVHPVAQPRDDGEVGRVGEPRRLGVHVDQRGEVLLPHGPGDGEDEGPAGLAQEWRQQSLGGGEVGPRRHELDARRDLVDAPGANAVVRGDLPLGLVARGRDHRVRPRDGAGFPHDPGVERRSPARGALVERQRVRGVDHRRVEARPRRERRLGRVGEVGVEHVGGPVDLEVGQQRLGEGGQLVGQVVLAQVSRARRREPPDRHPRGDLLRGRGVGGAEGGLVEPAGDDLHAHPRHGALRPGRPEDVGDVTARVLGHPVGHRGRLEAAAEGDVNDPHPGLRELTVPWANDPPPGGVPRASF